MSQCQCLITKSKLLTIKILPPSTLLLPLIRSLHMGKISSTAIKGKKRKNKATRLAKIL